MLIGIPPVIGPDLLAVLCRMGHGDEIVFADAHFPAESVGRRVIRADGLRIADLLDGAARLLPLDPYVPAPVAMMAAVPGDVLDPAVERAYRAAIESHQPGLPPIERIERFAFYERARRAFAVVATGDLAKYGNVILAKGLVLPGAGR
jgi:L-fucose mutarotase